jgi:hypothetical protein
MERMTPAELLVWDAFLRYRGEEEAKAMKRLNRR